MTKVINIGKVKIGGNNPIAIQSMTNIPITDINNTLLQIHQLESCGCDIVRIAIPDTESCKALYEVKCNTQMPIVADIHFDYNLAIKAIENGADKIRINPGNIGQDNLSKVVHCAKLHNIPIRIGVNSGSLDKHLLHAYNGKKSTASVASVLQYVQLIEALGYDNLVLSIKSSDVIETIQCNRQLSALSDYPLHLGVTEAGPSGIGALKGAIGIGSLLADGIGATIRVSLTAHPTEEISVARDILGIVGKKEVAQLVSCPKCGRCSYDIESAANTVYHHIKTWTLPIKVAVMGCEVNGPGECGDADIGMAGGKGKVAFFCKGKVYKTVSSEIAVNEFLAELDKFYGNFSSDNK